MGGGSPPSRGPACLLLPATLIPPCSGLQAEGLQLTWGCCGPARLNEARLSTGRQQPGAGHKRGAQEISHHDRLSPMSHQQGDLVCESLTLCPHVSGADWRGPVLTPQGCGELETFCRGRSTCQLQTQRVRSNTLGFLHLCKCLSFHYSKKKVCLRRVITSLHFLPSLSQGQETFYSGSQILFPSGGGRPQGNGPPLGIFTG